VCTKCIPAADFKTFVAACLTDGSTEVARTGECTNWASDKPYGTMPFWDTSLVLDMSNTFLSKGTFNGDISNWDTSRVTTMLGMFKSASAFNQNIGGWDVSQVTTMFAMFYQASAFNQSIENWDVSEVTTMNGMFVRAYVFNQPIGGWDVSKVTDMMNMFADAVVFNQPIGSWNVLRVTNMQGMFGSASAFNQNIGSWNVLRATNMREMFYSASVFNQPIGGWDVSQVQNMLFMFMSTSLFNAPIGRWDLSSVTAMDHMFHSARAFNQDISTWIGYVRGANRAWDQFLTGATAFIAKYTCTDTATAPVSSCNTIKSTWVSPPPPPSPPSHPPPPSPPPSERFPTVALTSASSNGYTVTSSSSYADFAGYYNWRLYNGNIANGWHTNHNLWSSSGATYIGAQSIGSYVGEWNKIKFPAHFVLQYLIITARQGYDTQAPKEWSIIGSNDDLNWTLLKNSIEKVPQSGINVQVNAGEAYTYFTLVIHKTAGSDACSASELEYHGYVRVIIA